MKMNERLKMRAISLLLSACILSGFFPLTAFATVTDANDWPIFAISEYDNPETQEVILQQMLQNSDRFATPWGTIAKKIIKQQKGDGIVLSGSTLNFQELAVGSPLIMKSSLSTAYNEAAGKLISFINGLGDISKGDLGATKSFLEGKGSNIAQIDSQGPAFARYQMRTLSGSAFGDVFTGYYGDAGAITIQLFYDFKVEGLSGRFKTPEFSIGDGMADLKSKGIIYALGGSSDSYTVKAENYNDFPNTVQKSYTYEKSTATSTEVSNSYTKDWSEETSVGVDIKLPFVNLVSAKVEQKVGYSYGISKTYSTSKSDTYTQSISDTIEVPLPPHTGIDIDVNIIDTTTSIPYTGAVRITYKTIVVYAAGLSEHADGQGSRQNVNGSFSFGNETYTAIQDLDRRIINAGIGGSDPDNLDLRSTSSGLMADTDFAAAANKLRSGQPYSPYGGVFNYTSKGTTITPRRVVPIYPADRFTPDIEEITLYEQQSRRLDGIKLAALNEYDVPYYGFNARLDGEWMVVDDDGDENTDYSEIDTDRNGYPVLKATAPNGSKKLYLKYRPNTSKVEVSKNYTSETILLKIKPVALSNVTLEGSLQDVILDDGENTVYANEYLTLTALDLDDQPFTPSLNAVKWAAEEEGRGITVTQKAYEVKLDFDRDGTYQIYAVVNETESNRIPLTVLPARQLEEITIEGEIPIIIWDDEKRNTFELDGITVSGKDQYGDVYTVNGEWALGSDGLEDEDARIAKVQGDVLTGLSAGSDMLWLRQNIDSNPIFFTVRDASYPKAIVIYGTIPELYYNNDIGNSFTLTNLDIVCYDQYGEPYTLEPDKYIWDPEKKDHAKIENNVLTGLVVGSNKLILSYPTKAKDDAGNLLGFISAAPLDIIVRAQPYVNELYQDAATPLIYEAEAFEISNIALKARDQYGNPITVPDDLQWRLADNNQTEAAVEGGKVTVVEGQVRYASWADVILEASSPSTGCTAKNVTLRVRQQPILTNLVAAVSCDFAPKWQENAVLSEYFTAKGFDQYGEPMPSNPVWESSNLEAVTVENGILTFVSEDGVSIIKAIEGNVVSNGITITVPGIPRVTNITVDGAPATAALKTQLALNALTAKVFDQYGQQLDTETLAAYPAAIRWTLEKGLTDAAIYNDTLHFGEKIGVMTLICTVVNSHTNNNLLQKRLDIRVGPSVTGITAAVSQLGSSGGDNRITVTGENLQNGMRISAFDSTGLSVPGISALTTGTAAKQSAVLKFPGNTDTNSAKTYVVRVSYNDGVVYETKLAAAVVVNKKDSGGGSGGGGGTGKKNATANSTPSYTAGLSGGVTGELPVKLDTKKGCMEVELNAIAGNIFAAEKSTLLTMPMIPGAESFILALLPGFFEGKMSGTMEVSIPYSPTTAELINPWSIILRDISDKDKAVCVPNGCYNPETGAVTFTTDHFGQYAIDYYKVSYGDVDDTAWYSEAIGFIAARDIASEIADKSFSPNALLTRGQFITMLLRAYGISAEIDLQDNFSDAGDTYYTGYLAAAKRLGISNGAGAEMFVPEGIITRQEMFTMLYRALKILNQLPDNTSDNGFSEFTDSNSVATYAKEAMANLVEAGIINGNQGKLEPTATVTRAEIAQVLFNLLSK